MALQDGNERVIEPLAVGKHRRNERDRMAAIEPGCLLCLHAVGRRVRFAGRIPGKPGQNAPEPPLVFGMAPRPGTGERLFVNLVNHCRLLFAQRSPKGIGPAGRQACEGVANLEDVFFVNDQVKSALEAWFQGGM